MRHPSLLPQPPPPRTRHDLVSAVLGGAGVLVMVGALAAALVVAGSGAPDFRVGAQADAPAGVPPAPIGHPVPDGVLTFTVLSTTTRTQVGRPATGGTRAQGVYDVIRVRARNRGDTPQALTDTAQELYGTNGRRYEANAVAALFAGPEYQSLYTDIPPETTATGLLLFDVPRDFTPRRVVLHESLLSPGAAVNLTRHV